ncbi:MAG TPA: glycosyltransferase family A protein [Turneriella sp.]|nr:glycosyltransferase family A protein [Turneriella sp.]HNL08908.1 glycosyltransferase family A protein [Turneriella sp.]HNN00896.1 glycosyltransferase family A protein [Turneriella sp.]
MTRVDVVIPAYGRQHLLGEAIASVQQQSLSDWHLWVIDDASAEAVAIPSGADSRVEIRRLPKNGGPAYARNFGAALGKAPFIAFLDSDDLWHPEKLQHALAAFAHDPELLWWHSNELWLRNGQPAKQKAIHRKQGGQFFERALERCLISPSAVVFRRDFFMAQGGFAPAFRLCEDYELWLRLLLHSPVGYSTEPLTIKRAGDWPQLSSAREIDRYRVLAMHRVWRLKRSVMPEAWQSALISECKKKCELLLAGAQKHQNERGQRRYQAWLTLFNTLRTRPIR